MIRNRIDLAWLESQCVYRGAFEKRPGKDLWLSLVVAPLLLISALSLSVPAATLPTGFVETTVANGLSSPTAMEFAPDGRLFVCLQGGNLRVIKNGALLATPFLTV